MFSFLGTEEWEAAVPVVRAMAVPEAATADAELRRGRDRSTSLNLVTSSLVAGNTVHCIQIFSFVLCVSKAFFVVCS